MNKPIRILAVACLVMFVGLLFNVNYIQALDADNLNAREGNRRVMDEQFSRERGAILVDGTAIAESVPSNDRWRFQRQYPEGPLYAPLTGYFSYIYGQSAIERSQNSILSGDDNRLFVNRVVDLLGNQEPQGGSVELTIDPVAQRAAAEGLRDLGEGTRGAVAAIDPQTGAVLALATQPSYDPNALASHDLQATNDAWDQLTNDDNQPMANRATQATLPPGSTFKLVTAAAAMENLDLNPDSQVKGGAELAFPGKTYTLPNQGGGNCGGDPITLRQALEVSCNVSFGDLANQVGEDELIEQAEKFGFGTDPISGIAANESLVTGQSSNLEDTQLAQTGIGQYEVTATPLQMAMVAAGIANDGSVMTPYLVDTVRAPNLEVLDTTKPERLSEAMSAGKAGQLKDMMVSVVDSGTGRPAAIPGVQVGGKTGTAESAEGRPPYAWFVGFAPADDPQVAVAVMVESLEGNTSDIGGGRLGGPIARAVMEAILR
ncbi:peptidoglycan D,D-transpeptidase FtsI family protein [Aeromicrobium piscarium]|uniref:Penicillin-binding protein 2 n=1 Tax=Aeromicrobium piscarium TaxID=2590901 RepID=A0A554RMM9_9ACTN|nr:penicillin-binding protein 2 [Aeromicrobium piscarium]TSD55398.1 penicillin-binding protein 2 [Aeromicrobium piscarium]